MALDFSCVAIVPARAGSKGISRKNARPFGGIPLIVRTVQAALAAKRITRVIVSSDDEEMMDLAREAGAEVPFKRPASLATDSSRTVDVIAHVLDYLRDSNDEPDMFVMLQPTSPFRTAEDVDGGVEKLRASEDAEALVSVCQASHHPMKMHMIAEGLLQPFVHNPYGTVNRNELPPAFQENGSLYVQTTKSFRSNATQFYCGLKSKKIMAYVMPAESSIDLDTEMDWAIGEMLLRHRESRDVAKEKQNNVKADTEAPLLSSDSAV
jgi:CMP-N,N'-diacetyllegionaminic acid synthase